MLVNFQCLDVQLIRILVGQGPSVLAVSTGGSCMDIFLLSIIFLVHPSLWEMARYGLTYCLKELFNSKKPTILH